MNYNTVASVLLMLRVALVMGGLVRYQQTIGNIVSCSGVGLHSGQPVRLTLRPASCNTGISFIRKNGEGDTVLPASVANRVSTELCTAIGTNGHQIKTIEHILAALAGRLETEFIDESAHLRGGQGGSGT